MLEIDSETIKYSIGKIELNLSDNVTERAETDTITLNKYEWITAGNHMRCEPSFDNI
jgi:hypothetical protein